MEKTIKKRADDTKLIKCTCKHDQQDQMYGKGMRLMNNAPAKGNKPNRFRCTVCKAEHNL